MALVVDRRRVCWHTGFLYNFEPPATSDDLVKQTQVNSKNQFLDSQDFQAAVADAVIDNQGAHGTMADYFCSDGLGANGFILT